MPLPNRTGVPSGLKNCRAPPIQSSVAVADRNPLGAAATKAVGTSIADRQTVIEQIRAPTLIDDMGSQGQLNTLKTLGGILSARHKHALAIRVIPVVDQVAQVLRRPFLGPPLPAVLQNEDAHVANQFNLWQLRPPHA